MSTLFFDTGLISDLVSFQVNFVVDPSAYSSNTARFYTLEMYAGGGSFPVDLIDYTTVLNILAVPDTVNHSVLSEPFGERWLSLGMTNVRTHCFEFLDRATVSNPTNGTLGIVGIASAKSENVVVTVCCNILKNTLNNTGKTVLLASAMLPSANNADSKVAWGVFLRDLKVLTTTTYEATIIFIANVMDDNGDTRRLQRSHYVRGIYGYRTISVSFFWEYITTDDFSFYRLTFDLASQSRGSTGFISETSLSSINLREGLKPIPFKDLGYAVGGPNSTYRNSYLGTSFLGLQINAVLVGPNVAAVDLVKAYLKQQIQDIHNVISVQDASYFNQHVDYSNYTLVIIPNAVPELQYPDNRVYNQALMTPNPSQAQLDSALFADTRSLTGTIHIVPSASFQSKRHITTNTSMSGLHNADTISYTVAEYQSTPSTTWTSKIIVGNNLRGNARLNYELITEIRGLKKAVRAANMPSYNNNLTLTPDDAFYFSCLSVTNSTTWKDRSGNIATPITYSTAALTHDELPPVLRGTPNVYINSNKVVLTNGEVAVPVTTLINDNVVQGLSSIKTVSGGSVQVQLSNFQIVGQTQRIFLTQRLTDPVLIGYVESPPPFPGENMTEQTKNLKYNHTDAINTRFTQALTQTVTTDDFSIIETGATNNLSVLAGVVFDTSVSFLSSPKSGVKGGVQIGPTYSNSSSTSVRTSPGQEDYESVSSDDTEVTSSMSGYMELANVYDSTIDRPGLPLRYVPNNEGTMYVEATVVDEFAVVYNGIFIKRQQVPVVLQDGTINKVKTALPFPLNPSYRLVGSLDGTIGRNKTLQDPWIPTELQYNYTLNMFNQGIRSSYYNPDQLSLFRTMVTQNTLNIGMSTSIYITKATSMTGNSFASEKTVTNTADEVTTTSSNIGVELNASLGLYVFGFGGGVDLSYSHDSFTNNVTSINHNIVENITVSISDFIKPYILDNPALMWLSVTTNQINGSKVALTATLIDSLPIFDKSIINYYVAGLGYTCIGIQSPNGVLLCQERPDGRVEPLQRLGKVQNYVFETFYIHEHESSKDAFFNLVADPHWISTNTFAKSLDANTKTNNVSRVAHVVSYVDRIGPKVSVPGLPQPDLAPTTANVLVYAGIVSQANPAVAPLATVDWNVLRIGRPTTLSDVLVLLRTIERVVGVIVHENQFIAAVVSATPSNINIPEVTTLPSNDAQFYMYLVESHVQQWNAEHTDLIDTLAIATGSLNSGYIRTNFSTVSSTVLEHPEIMQQKVTLPFTWLNRNIPYTYVLVPRIMFYHYYFLQQKQGQQAPVTAVQPQQDLMQIFIDTDLEATVLITPNDLHTVTSAAWIGIIDAGVTPTSRNQWAFSQQLYAEAPPSFTIPVSLPLGKLNELLQPADTFFDLYLHDGGQVLTSIPVKFNNSNHNSTLSTYEPLKVVTSANADFTVTVSKVNSTEFLINVTRINPLGVVAHVNYGGTVKLQGQFATDVLSLNVLDGIGTDVNLQIGLQPEYYEVILLDVAGTQLGTPLTIYSHVATV